MGQQHLEQYRRQVTAPMRTRYGTTWPTIIAITTTWVLPAFPDDCESTFAWDEEMAWNATRLAEMVMNLELAPKEGAPR